MSLVYPAKSAMPLTTWPQTKGDQKFLYLFELHCLVFSFYPQVHHQQIESLAQILRFISRQIQYEWCKPLDIMPLGLRSPSRPCQNLNLMRLRKQETEVYPQVRGAIRPKVMGVWPIWALLPLLQHVLVGQPLSPTWAVLDTHQWPHLDPRGRVRPILCVSVNQRTPVHLPGHLGYFSLNLLSQVNDCLIFGNINKKSRVLGLRFKLL